MHNYRKEASRCRASLRIRREDACLVQGSSAVFLIGAITAIAFWGIYNPAASFYDTQLEVRPVIGALLAGVGGGRVLSGLVERVITRTNLSSTQEAAERTASTMIGGEDDRTAAGD